MGNYARTVTEQVSATTVTAGPELTIGKRSVSSVARGHLLDRPFPSEVLDRDQLVDRCIVPLEVVTPGPVAGRDLVMKRPLPGELGVRQRPTRRDEPVAVAVLVPAPQRERSMTSPLPEQLGEDLIEMGDGVMTAGTAMSRQ